MGVSRDLKWLQEQVEIGALIVFLQIFWGHIFTYVIVLPKLRKKLRGSYLIPSPPLPPTLRVHLWLQNSIQDWRNELNLLHIFNFPVWTSPELLVRFYLQWFSKVPVIIQDFQSNLVLVKLKNKKGKNNWNWFQHSQWKSASDDGSELRPELETRRFGVAFFHGVTHETVAAQTQQFQPGRR